MLVFIIPLKSKKKCKSWKLVSDLCTRTIKSACAQRNRHFHVILVCNETPDLGSLNALQKQKLLVVNTPYPELDKNLGVDGNIIKFDIASEHDKAEKLKIGFDIATVKFQATHVMPIDADDCVSNMLSEYPIKDPASAGWFAQQGYVYSEGSNFLIRKLSRFQGLSGSSLIVRSDLWKSTLREKNGYLFYVHGTGSVISLKLKPLSFPAAVYSINNGENYHMTRDLKKKLITDRRFANFKIFYKRLKNYRIEFFRESHAEHFGLYRIKNVNKNS